MLEETTPLIPEVASGEVSVEDSEVAMEMKTEGILDFEAATTVGVAMGMAMVVALVMETLVAMAMGTVVVTTVEVVVAMAAEAATSLEDTMVGRRKALDGAADEGGEVFVEGGGATKAYLG